MVRETSITFRAAMTCVHDPCLLWAFVVGLGIQNALGNEDATDVLNDYLHKLAQRYGNAFASSRY